jgi:hypothetical protein
MPGVQACDIEPALMCKYIDDILVLSRYHFHWLTIWINPPIEQVRNISKPVIIFAKGVHTPILWMQHNWKMTEISVDKHRFWHFRYKIPADSLIKQWFKKFLNDSKLSNPVDYPCILNEVKPNFVQDQLRFLTRIVEYEILSMYCL